MLLILFLVSTVLAKTNNVCKTYSDYANIKTNPNCWYNPDVGASPRKMVHRQGFPFESYQILTQDGYILGLFRIPHNNTNVGRKRQPVYLHHGLLQCSHTWYNHGPRSLAFALSNEGYDVWMVNSRGTRYSLKHLTYTTQGPQFWNFSWSDYGLYDTPANLKFIHKKTGLRVIYVGYSIGTTASYVYSIEKPEEAHQLVKGIVSLAPSAYYRHLRSILKYLVPFKDILVDIATLLGVYSIGAHLPREKPLISAICSVYPFNKFCVFVLFLALGFDYEEFQPEDLPVLLDDGPDGISIKGLYHFLQIVANGGRFQKFDYGILGNLRAYGSTQPPEYDVGIISNCVHLFHGLEDYIANPPDVRALHKKLSCSTLNTISVNGTIPYNHLDYVYGKSVESAMYPILFRRMKEVLREDG